MKSTDIPDLRITEIFLSLQGESRTIGFPTVFVRLTGCPLRCGYCDTAYAFSGGERMSIDQIITQVQQYQVQHVTITGGEPLAQKPVFELLERLADCGLEVSLETSGAISMDAVDPRITKVMDLKTPGSGELQRNLWCNLEYLTLNDQVKFVLCDEADYQWAKDKMKEHQLAEHAEVLFSPVSPGLSATELADWIVKDRLPVRFQLQLHKLLWEDAPGH